MNTITVKVDGDKKLVAKMGRIGAEARVRVKRLVQRLGFQLVSHIQTTKLRGQRLNQRSGRLIASVHEETVETENSVASTVGTNVIYARPHEYGFLGSVEVKAHMRLIKKAWGRPIAAKEVAVRAHTAKRDMTERRMFRDSLDEFRPRTEAAMTKLAQDLANEVVKP